jgi:hypothetical protein
MGIRERIGSKTANVAAGFMVRVVFRVGGFQEQASIAFHFKNRSMRSLRLSPSKAENCPDLPILTIKIPINGQNRDFGT